MGGNMLFLETMSVTPYEGMYAQASFDQFCTIVCCAVLFKYMSSLDAVVECCGMFIVPVFNQRAGCVNEGLGACGNPMCKEKNENRH